MNFVTLLVLFPALFPDWWINLNGSKNTFSDCPVSTPEVNPDRSRADAMPLKPNLEKSQLILVRPPWGEILSRSVRVLSYKKL
jgi:hypothetical protein